jgi:hypothetical protein
MIANDVDNNDNDYYNENEEDIYKNDTALRNMFENR